MRQITRSLVVVCLLGFAASTFAAPRERDSTNGVRKFVKRVIRALGDGLILPTPAPTPAPKP